jgi:hypothetical protein
MLGFTLGFTLGFHKLIKMSLGRKYPVVSFFEGEKKLSS